MRMQLMTFRQRLPTPLQNGRKATRHVVSLSHLKLHPHGSILQERLLGSRVNIVDGYVAAYERAQVEVRARVLLLNHN